MKKFIFILLFLPIASTISICQPGFNNKYDEGFPRNQFRRVLVINDTIIGYGMARPKDPPFYQCLYFARYDSSGLFIDNQLICDSLGWALSTGELWADIEQTNDGGFLATAFTFASNDAMAIKFDRHFQTEFVKVYPDMTSLVKFPRSIVELDDGYIVGGDAQRNDYYIDAFIRKIDKQGNTQWMAYYGEPKVDEYLKEFILINDSTILAVGGYVLNKGNTEADYSSWMVQFDFDGNIIKEFKPDPNGPIDICSYVLKKPSNDGYLVFGRNALKKSPSLEEVANFAAVMDTAFKVTKVNNYEVSKDGLINVIYNIFPTKDGNYMGVGQRLVGSLNFGRYQGWFVKFNSEGDTVWTKNIEPVFENTVPSRSFLGGGGELSSGNIIAGGMTETGNLAYCWLVKITPDGCVDSIFCSPVPVGEIDGNAEKPTVFPNPSNGIVNIWLPESVGTQEMSIFDLTGRLVFQQEIINAASVDLHFLPPGIYSTLFRDSKRIHFQSKIVLTN